MALGVSLRTYVLTMHKNDGDNASFFYLFIFLVFTFFYKADMRKCRIRRQSIPEITLAVINCWKWKKPATAMKPVNVMKPASLW